MNEVDDVCEPPGIVYITHSVEGKDTSVDWLHTRDSNGGDCQSCPAGDSLDELLNYDEEMFENASGETSALEVSILNVWNDRNYFR